MARTEVVHVMRDAYDVYVGRPSPFGNPFMIGRDGTREEVIDKYRDWLWSRMKEDSDFRAQVKGLAGKRLACWCAPERCHADVLAMVAAFMAGCE